MVMVGRSSAVAGVRWLHHRRAEGLGVGVVWCGGLVVLLARISVAGGLTHLLRRCLAMEGVLRVEGLLLGLWLRVARAVEGSIRISGTRILALLRGNGV